MYIQITEKCNMHCEHCCMDSTIDGKHAEMDIIYEALKFCRDRGYEGIFIGGGEPTLHPNFFEILKVFLDNDFYVWMATNGSQTDIMFRLDNILNQCDYPECTCEENFPEDYEEYGCLCHERMDYDYIYIENEDKLQIALSQDCFHDPIDDCVIDIWKRSKREIRDVTHTVSKNGRAEENSVWVIEDECCCASLICKINGDIKLCGCANAPIIGNVMSGIKEEWEDFIMSDEGFIDNMCFNKSDLVRQKGKLSIL